MVCRSFTLPSAICSPQIRSDDPLLQRHKVSLETAFTFGMCSNTGTELPVGSILVPLRDRDGTTVGYAPLAKNKTGRRPCTVLPTSLDRTQIVFNLNRAIGSGEQVVIVVEDLIDCVRIHQASFPSVVALLGPKMSEAQEVSILEKFRRIVLMLRGDDLGWASTQDCIRRLATQAWVHAAVLPSGKGPAELTDTDLVAAIRYAR